SLENRDYFLSTDIPRIRKRDLSFFLSSEVSPRLLRECFESAPGLLPTHRRPAVPAIPPPRLESHRVVQARTLQCLRPACPASVPPVRSLRVRRDYADTKSSLQVAPRQESRRSAARVASHRAAPCLPP